MKVFILVACALAVASGQETGDFTVAGFKDGFSAKANDEGLVKVQTLGELPTDMPIAPKTYDQRPKILGVDVLDAPGAGGKALVQSLSAVTKGLAAGQLSQTPSANAPTGRLGKLQAVLEKLDARQTDLESKLGVVSSAQSDGTLENIERTNNEILTKVAEVADRISSIVEGGSDQSTTAPAVSGLDGMPGANALDKLQNILTKLKSKGQVLDALTAGKAATKTVTATASAAAAAAPNAEASDDGYGYGGNPEPAPAAGSTASAENSDDGYGYGGDTANANANTNANANANTNANADAKPASNAEGYGDDEGY